MRLEAYNIKSSFPMVSEALVEPVLQHYPVKECKCSCCGNMVLIPIIVDADALREMEDALCDIMAETGYSAKVFAEIVSTAYLAKAAINAASEKGSKT